MSLETFRGEEEMKLLIEKCEDYYARLRQIQIREMDLRKLRGQCPFCGETNCEVK